MNFFNKLFGKRDTQRDVKRDEPIEFRFDELDDWLSDKKGDWERDTYREAAPVLGEIAGAVKNIKKRALEMNAMKCPNDIPQRAKKVILTSKPEFVRGILDTIHGIEKKPGEKDLEAFDLKLQNALSSLLKVIMGPGRYLPLAFGEELEGLGRKSRYLFEKEKELKELIEGNVFEDIEGDFRVLEGRIASLTSLDKGGVQFTSGIEELKAEGERVEGEYKQIDRTGEFRDFLEKEHKLREIKKKKEELENYIYNLLTPLKRPLKRLKKSVQEGKGGAGISPGEIERYVQNPMEMFLSIECGRINQFFSGIRQLVDRGELGIKEHERMKIISKINSALDADLEKLKGDFLLLAGEEEEISKEMETSPVLFKKKNLETNIARIKREITQREDGMERMERKRERLGGEIDKLKNALEGRLTDMENIKVILKLE